MNRNATSLIIGFTLFTTHVASAAGSGDQGRSDSITSPLLSILPVLLFVGALLFFYRRQLKSPVVQLQQQYLERQIQHTQRVEELLERIATALEKNSNNAAN